MRAEIKNDLGQVLGVTGLRAKQFKTGSVGYHGSGIFSMDGKSYVMNIILVELGSNKKSKKQN